MNNPIPLTEDEILKYDRMIKNIIRHNFIFGWDKEDIIQECWLYLISALARYDESKGSKDGFVYLSVRLQLRQLKTLNQFKISAKYRNAIANYEIEKTKNPGLTTDQFLLQTKMFKSIIGRVKKCLDKHNIFPHDRHTSLNQLIEENKYFDYSTPPAVEQELEYEELVEVCKRNLSPLENKVFFLKEDGYSYDEIEVLIHIPKVTLKVINKTAKHKLQKAVSFYLEGNNAYITNRSKE